MNEPSLFFEPSDIMTRSVSEMFNDSIFIPSPSLMLGILSDYKKDQEKITLTLDEINLLPIKQKKFTCPICLNDKTRGVTLSCNHMFCKKCITIWLSKHVNSCPNCRCKIYIKSPK